MTKHTLTTNSGRTLEAIRAERNGEAVVEFYDVTKGKAQFFGANYYFKTLLANREALSTNGLCLHGSFTNDYGLSPEETKALLDWMAS